MEEKLSALEALGVFKGLLFTSQWNIHSTPAKTKNISKFTQTVPVSFNSKSSKEIKLPENVTNLSQNIEIWNGSTTQKFKEKDVPLKSCREKEMIKSEINIPENDEKTMNANNNKFFVNKEKTEDYSKNIKIDETIQTALKNTNSFDGVSEEIESSESEEANHENIRKQSSSSVQEWVDHLPLKNSINLNDVSYEELKENSHEGPSTEGNALVRAQLSRESSSSLDSILDSRRPDPVEIFLSLGFGGLPGVDTENCRIPKRFLIPSQCKGGDWNEFLKRELIQAQNFECSSLGFRGLSGPSYRRPSAIVANIMEKLRERAGAQPHNRSKFSTVAKMVLNEKSVLNKLTPEFQSVLSPDNRKFLQNQGKKSPEVPRRRIIFGQKSFAFARDGEFVEVESSNVEEKTRKDSPVSLTSSDGEESTVYPNPDVLLKLRRSSLHKQKKVEDSDIDDVFYVVGNEGNAVESSYNSNNSNNTSSSNKNNINSIRSNNNNNKNNYSNNNNSNNNNSNSNNNNNNNNNECSKKTDKIPRRFLSSSNLKALEENNVSEAMRIEVEKEIISLSQKIKSISNQNLPSVLQQIKELRSRIENTGRDSSEV